MLCDVFANYSFWHEIIRIKLDHFYRFATYTLKTEVLTCNTLRVLHSI